MLAYNSFPISVLTLTYSYQRFKNSFAYLQLRKLSFDFYKASFQHLLSFLNKMEPICVIHNISIATVYDVIIPSDDVRIYSVDLFMEIVTLNTLSVGKRNAIISDYDFFHVFVFRFGNSFMATECMYHHYTTMYINFHQNGIISA